MWHIMAPPPVTSRSSRTSRSRLPAYLWAQRSAAPTPSISRRPPVGALAAWAVHGTIGVPWLPGEKKEWKENPNAFVSYSTHPRSSKHDKYLQTPHVCEWFCFCFPLLCSRRLVDITPHSWVFKPLGWDKGQVRGSAWHLQFHHYLPLPSQMVDNNPKSNRFQTVRSSW